MTTNEQPRGRVYRFAVGDRIRTAREQAGMDQSELAEQSGISRQTISNYERHATKPSRGNVRLISWATGFDYDWLMTGREDIPGPTGGDARTRHLHHTLRLAA